MVQKSTNWTVNSIFRDIYDRESSREPEDQYDIAKDWLPNVGLEDDNYRKQLSTGLMFVAMVKSEAATLFEYIDYLKANNFIKDTISFDQILSLNGFDTKGRFTIDGEGNPIVYE